MTTVVCGHCRLESRQHDRQNEYTEQQAAAVGDGIDDGIFVQLAPGGLEPEAADPEQKDGNEQPEALGVGIELGCIEIGDVEREHGYRDVAGGRAEAAKLLQIADVIAAALGDLSSPLAQVFEFGEALDEGQGEKEEDAEAAKPGGGLDAGSSGAGEDADGIEAGENDDVDQDGPFQAQRIGQRGGGIDSQPDKEAIRPPEGKCRLRRVRAHEGARWRSPRRR